MSKIGSSVLKSHITNSNVLTKAWYNGSASKEKVCEVLKATNEPMNISRIARKADLSWFTTKQALSDLLIEGRVILVSKGTNATLFKVK